MCNSGFVVEPVSPLNPRLGPFYLPLSLCYRSCSSGTGLLKFSDKGGRRVIRHAGKWSPGYAIVERAGARGAPKAHGNCSLLCFFFCLFVRRLVLLGLKQRDAKNPEIPAQLRLLLFDTFYCHRAEL